MQILESNLVFKSLTYGNNPNKIIVHHAESKSCTIQDIHAWHLANGWAGCGYHFFVDKQGNIYRGRPENAIGAHCLNQNAQSIGICAEGDYMTETMPVAQKQAILDLIVYLKNKYGAIPVLGHAEAMNYETECPGTNYPLQDIKDGVLGSVEEEEEMKKIVLYLGDADIFPAIIVAQKNQCPLMLKSDFENSGLKSDEMITIGGKPNSTRFSTFKDAAELV